MKKIFGAIIMAALAMPVFAQNSEEGAQTKDASEYLPSAGEFAIGFNLNPFVNFVGNMFNNGANATIDNATIGGQPLALNAFVSLTNKYMLSDHLAVRTNLGLIWNRENDNQFVQDDAELAKNPLSKKQVVDKIHYAQTGGSFSVGVESRTGKGRLQGVFSGSGLFAFATEKETYTYGNAITEYNQTPSTAIAGAWVGSPFQTAVPNTRLLKQYTTGAGATRIAGLVGSMGIEYFVAPKVSLGAEVNVSILYRWTPKTYTVVEGFNLNTGEVEEFTDLLTPKSSGFFFGTQNIGANLFANFFFGN